MSGSKFSQLKTLVSIIGAVFLLFLILELLIFGVGCAIGDCQPKEFFSIISGTFSIFIDPGSVWNYDFATAKAMGNNEGQATPSPGFWSLLVSTVGLILFVGFLVSSITNMMEREIERYRNGRMHFRQENHVVIIGFTDIVPMLVNQLCTTHKYDDCNILIQSATDTAVVRSKVFSELNYSQEKRVFFLNAKRDSMEELEHLYVPKAKEVFLIGDKNEDYHDSMNLNCLDKLVSQLKKHHSGDSPKIDFNVFFNNQNTFAAFQTTDIKEDWKQYINFKAYHFYDEWARRLLVDLKWIRENNEPITYPSLDRGLVTADSKKHVHFVIVGMNSMGVSLGTMASHTMHFPNFFDKDCNELPEHSTVITFIDENAGTEMNYFRSRYNGYFDICDCTYRDYVSGNGSTQTISSTSTDTLPDFLDIKYEFVRGTVEMPEVRALLEQWTEDENEILTIAICFDDASRCLAAGLYLPEIIYSDRVPVFIRQESSAALLEQLGCGSDGQATKYRKYQEVYPFGMLDKWFELDNKKHRTAKLINSLYYFYGKKELLPDYDQLLANAEKSWDEASVSDQWSNLYACNSLGVKLRSLGVPMENVRLTKEQVHIVAAMEHARWNMEKLLMGYRMPKKTEIEEIYPNGKYNKEKKNWYQERFIHAFIAPYNYLSDETKQYDINIAVSIGNILNIVGEVIE